MNLYKIQSWREDFPDGNEATNVFVAHSTEEAERMAMGCEVVYTNGKGGSWAKLPHDCKILESRTLPENLIPEVSKLPVEDWGSLETERSWELTGAQKKQRLETGRSSIYVNETMADRLSPLVDRFGGLSKTVTIVADRYQQLMLLDRRVLRELFSQAEVNLMLNNALSTTYEPAAIIVGAVLAEVLDEQDSVFAFYGADRGALTEKLKSLTTGQAFALVDWLEEQRGNIPKETDE